MGLPARSRQQIPDDLPVFRGVRTGLPGARYSPTLLMPPPRSGNRSKEEPAMMSQPTTTHSPTRNIEHPCIVCAPLVDTVAELTGIQHRKRLQVVWGTPGVQPSWGPAAARLSRHGLVRLWRPSRRG